MFQAILNAIKQYDTIIIHRHKSPDGDALGAQTGLKLLLQAAYPHKRVLAVGDMTPRYAFIGPAMASDNI